MNLGGRSESNRRWRWRDKRHGESYSNPQALSKETASHFEGRRQKTPYIYFTLHAKIDHLLQKFAYTVKLHRLQLIRRLGRPFSIDPWSIVLRAKFYFHSTKQIEISMFGATVRHLIWALRKAFKIPNVNLLSKSSTSQDGGKDELREEKHRTTTCTRSMRWSPMLDQSPQQWTTDKPQQTTICSFTSMSAHPVHNWASAIRSLVVYCSSSGRKRN